MAFDAPSFANPADMIVYASTVTGGWFWLLVLASIWIVSFGGMLYFTTTERALSSSSFFVGILSSMLYVMGALDGALAVIFIALTLGTFLVMLFTNKGR